MTTQARHCEECEDIGDAYKEEIYRLIRSGLDGLSILDQIMDFNDSFDDMLFDGADNWEKLNENERIHFKGVRDGYANVRDWVHFIKWAMAK
jgi:hypothetical protein